MPSRRTITVLLTLLGAMVSASGLLVALEPGPIAPLAGISLSNTSPSTTPTRNILFDTFPPPHADRWSQIRVSYSGSPFGSTRTIHEEHQRQGLGGLGYHFVIGNGKGADDGQITVGFRWRRQLDGMRPTQQILAAMNGTSTLLHRPIIDICLVGDGIAAGPTDAQLRELVWLVQQLQGKLRIGPEQVVIAHEDGAAGSPAGAALVDALSPDAVRFPTALFRQQLLSSAAP